jgi:hypothetical protein
VATCALLLETFRQVCTVAADAGARLYIARAMVGVAGGPATRVDRTLRKVIE